MADQVPDDQRPRTVTGGGRKPDTVMCIVLTNRRLRCVAAIRADDELLDALGARSMGGAAIVDDDLTWVLLGWRNEADDAAEVPELLDTDRAVVVLRRAARRYRARRAAHRVTVAALAVWVVLAWVRRRVG